MRHCPTIYMAKPNIYKLNIGNPIFRCRAYSAKNAKDPTWFPGVCISDWQCIRIMGIKFYDPTFLRFIKD